MSASGTPVGYSAFRQQDVKLDENGQRKKRLGRPVGWRKAIHSKAALAEQGIIPASEVRSNHHTGEPRRRGRASKHTVYTAPRREQEPHFAEYPCQYQACNAILHNIDTVRKHVLKVHGLAGKDGKYACLWGGCDQFIVNKKVHRPYDFNDVSSWFNHLEEEHIMPLARTLGDGPRRGLSGQTPGPSDEDES